ncbi:MAG: deoxyribodipyrimidine photo-lyase [Paracoccaceae bacterium]
MNTPIIVWFRRDLRLSDHAALSAAQKSNRPVIPAFIRDATVDALGAAPKWRLGLGLDAFARSLNAVDCKLVLRSGDAQTILAELVAETGATSVYWTRAYDPASTQRDTAIKSFFREAGVEAKSFGGHLMFEPWTVETKMGGFYRVYSPYWRAVKDRHIETPLAKVTSLLPPSEWPNSECLEDWRLGQAMRRGASVVLPFAQVGEDAAQQRLDEFVQTRVDRYKADRDFPAIDATSCLSENLALGEISPQQCWHAGMRALHEGCAGAEHFLKEVVWREFAYHLMYHTPEILTGNWKPDWDKFPWNTDETHSDVIAWKQGRTGIRFVDSAMRELYVTGRMHNRARMIVASYLTKHLMTHWKIGKDWFENCLIDWDPAANAMGWQWAAGSGPDAAPYFRVFNPVSQLEKFDPHSHYVDRWIAEGKSDPHPDALRYFDAVPRSWNLSPSAPYPAPIVTAADGRARALSAYEGRDF